MEEAIQERGEYLKLEDEEKSESMKGKNEEEKKKKIRVESSSIREDKGRKKD